MSIEKISFHCKSVVGKVKDLLSFIVVVLTIVIILSCIKTTSETNQESALIQNSFVTEKAIEANIAANAVGINTHINYTGTIYDTRYHDIIKPRLAELGTKHIRDHFGNTTINARFQELAHNYNIKLLIINNDGGKDLETTRQEIKRLNAINPDKPVVESIEPANERDNGWKKTDGSSDWERLCIYMENYYTVFKNDQATANIPLLGPSFANTRKSAESFSGVCNKINSLIDIGNTHIYSGLNPENGLSGGWEISLDVAIANYKKISGDKLIIDSETGYKMSSGQSGHPAVSQRTAAKYAPRLVLNRVKKGFERVYFYQLINNSEDFGLLNNDGSPRLQFTALKNFISLMNDPGENFMPGTLSFNLDGDLKDIEHMVFQKRDGRFYLLVWQGANCSSEGTNNNNYIDINNTERKITLTFKEKIASVKQYRPSFDAMPDGNGINPVAENKNITSLVLNVPDHILVIEININQ
ncbi:MAG: hypothetical protein GZ094_24000 [Mariniphaga sp.]|nr:hypothetical protein [Mariniphaga sp.]